MEEMKKENEQKMEEMKKENKGANTLIKELYQILEETRKKNQESEKNNQENIEQLKKEIKNLQNKNNSNIFNEPNNHNINNESNSNNIITKINNYIKNKKEEIIKIIGLKNGMICLLGLYNSYIIKNNSLIAFLEGYRNLILLLNNGDLLSSKSRKILIYDSKNFVSPKKEINMNCYSRQIIELYDNKILFLSTESNLILIENYNIENTNKFDYLKDKKIVTMILIINDEIAFISFDKIIYFFNFEKNKEVKQLKLSGYGNIYMVDIASVKGNNLYIGLMSSIFKIDIKKKEIIGKHICDFSYISKFNSNLYGISKYSIYQITDDNNKININQIYKDTAKIKSLYQIGEKRFMICTEKEIKICHTK